MKKLLLTSALVAAMSTAAMADTSGFFAGVYGGYMGSSTSADTTNGLANANTSKVDFGGNGGQGGLMLGYNYAMDNGAVVGLDAFGQFGSHEAEVTNANNNALTLGIKHKYAFGIAARFGYMFDTTHAYLRVGYINGRNEMRVNQSEPNEVVIATRNIVKKNHSGLLLGVGADMPVGEMITVGFNYDFALYKKETVAARINTHNVAEFKPRTHAFNVVLKYKF